MEHNQTNLFNLLKEALGSENVYFQPPTLLKYPCILCELSDFYTANADNLIYRKMKHYTVTLIGKNFNTDTVIEKLLAIDHCSFNRRFISDGLYHDVFDLYF